MASHMVNGRDGAEICIHVYAVVESAPWDFHGMVPCRRRYGHAFASESASFCSSMRNGDFMQQHVTLMEANSALLLCLLPSIPREKTDIIYTRNCTLRTAHAAVAAAAAAAAALPCD